MRKETRGRFVYHTKEGINLKRTLQVINVLTILDNRWMAPIQ